MPAKKTGRHPQRGMTKRGDHGRQRIADGEARLHEPQRFTAMLMGQVSDTSAAPVAHSPPTPAHTQTQRGQFPKAMGESASSGKKRINNDADDQRHAPAQAVGKETEQDAAGGGGNERDGSEQAGLRGRELQCAQEFAQNHGVKRDVHSIGIQPRVPAAKARRWRGELEMRKASGFAVIRNPQYT